MPKIRGKKRARPSPRALRTFDSARFSGVFSEKKCCNTAASSDNDSFIYTIFINQKKE